ncbi:hypothetical protein, partial [Tepidimonas taiwanensis]|uniref:hypothetical protein n=1 Tax=Tepidimonas taiwanensis TaxID=307486 RepID=UPI001E4447D5
PICEVLRLRCAVSDMMLVLMVCGMVRSPRSQDGRDGSRGPSRKRHPRGASIEWLPTPSIVSVIVPQRQLGIGTKKAPKRALFKSLWVACGVYLLVLFH